MKKIKILLAEDDLIDQMAFSRMVQEEGLAYDFAIASSLAEAKRRRAETAFEVVLSDNYLGDGTAEDILKIFPDTPVIVITGAGNEELAASLLKGGATDYLVKDVDRKYLKLLPHAVKKVLKLKKADETLRNYYKNLEAQVAERTAELQEALLLTEAADRVKTDFLGNISHELVTPLNAIIGFAALLEDGIAGSLNDKQREFLAHILAGGKRLHQIITEIIDMMRIEAGDLDLCLERFSLKDLLSDLISMMQEKALTRGITINLTMSPEAEIEIEADKKRVKHIFANLINNAVKFNMDGGAVRVSARLAADGGNMVEISVADTGIGISKEDLPQLFLPFRQLEASLTKKFAGTGLGLAVTKRLVELHGGRIWCASELAQGSTFIVALPVRQKSRLKTEG